MDRKTGFISPKLEEILQSVGENIKLARLCRKITTTILSERADISSTTLRKVENGESSVTMGIYANVLFYLKLEQDLLLLANSYKLDCKSMCIVM